MKIKSAAFAFLPTENILSCEEFGHGRINSTYLIGTDDGKTYVLQQINKYVFKEPDKLMENASAVTNHLHKRSKGTCKTLRYLPAKSGLYYYLDKHGEYWRMYEYVPGISLNAPESDQDLYQSALTFGRFQNLLADFPADKLHETIPCFHNTIDRYRLFKQAIAADRVGRAASVQPEIDFLMARERLAGKLQHMLDAGELPLRVTHNDTKLNNVLLDEKTHEGVCVLDLDTVMPGSSLYDYGDAIRFGAATGGEDEADPTANQLDMHLFEVYTDGYLEAVPSLTDKEVNMLPMGALTMTLELAVRFLTDYLDGDRYFKISSPDENLIHARSQIALAADIEKKLPKMEQIVAELRRK